jgi:hypothetical protein
MDWSSDKFVSTSLSVVIISYVMVAKIEFRHLQVDQAVSVFEQQT